jgi:hypothetical protein
LEKYILHAIEELKYGEAEIAKSRISFLKGALTKKKKKELENQHNMELQSLEEQFNTQMNEFNLEWDNKIRQFNEQVQNQELEMTTRHNMEIAELKKNFNENSNRFKYSKTLLDLKNQQIHLVKQQLYFPFYLVSKKLK